MRPTTSAMLQQNNNNNYPCLNMSGSTREILQKCSKASLPLPSRLELGLGDLPLIRGLRAWALCSKNRRKGGGFLGGGQAPTAPPAGRRGSTSCPRPAGVYLSGEWGRMGYGLPFGLDAGQAGIGALVTVATLKTSEGSGKTQTQCLFLRTEKGSCLYSTAKPDSGVISSTGSGVVRGWLRGKTGGGGRDTPGGRRDHGLTPPAQTGANRVRLRSGRRWRKSCSAAGREKTGVSRETQQNSREDRAGEIILEERQEEREKGGLDSKQIPSLQEDIGEARQEKEGASPRCCHNVPSRTCILSERSAQRESHERGESPRGGVPNRLNSEVKGMRKERQRNEEEENGGLCSLESSNSVLAALNPDLEYNRFQPESHSSQEARGAENNEEMKTQTSRNKDVSMVREEETHSRFMKIHPNNDSIHGQPERDFAISHNRDSDDRKQSENPCEGIVANAKGFSDCMEVHQDSERDMESVDEEEGSINHTAEFWEASKCCEDLPVSTCPLSISAAVFPLPSHPVEGSTCNGDHDTCGVLRAPVSSKGYHLERYQESVADSGIEDKEELDGRRFEQQELNCVSDENNTVNENRKPQFFFKNVEKRSREERNASPTPLNHADGSIFEVDGWVAIENTCDYSTTELTGTEWRDELLKENRAEESQTENVEQGVNREERDEAGGIWVRVSACTELDDADGEGDKNDINESETREEDDEGFTLECAQKDSWREAVDGCRGRREEVGDTCGPESTTHIGANGETSTNFTYFGCADPSTSPGLPLANPAPSLPPLGSMATSLPRLEVEKEEEGVSLKTGDKEGGREGKTRHGRELEEQGEEKRGSAVANEEKGTEEEDEEEFGVFMQAEGEPTWSERSAMSASVPCGSRVSVAHGNHAISRESIHWTPGWTDSSLHQSDDTWTAFPQDSADERRDIVGQWWPTSTVEEGKDRLSTNQNLVAVFAEAFPSLPRLSSSDPSGLDTVPTLTQLLRGKASQDQGLLDSFHDLNKIICQRYKRATGMSRDLLLKTLHLEQPHSESRPASWAASGLSPGLPSANHHAQNAAAKRRLSYDCNRNIME